MESSPTRADARSIASHGSNFTAGAALLAHGANFARKKKDAAPPIKAARLGGARLKRQGGLKIDLQEGERGLAITRGWLDFLAAMDAGGIQMAELDADRLEAHGERALKWIKVRLKRPAHKRKVSIGQLEKDLTLAWGVIQTAQRIREAGVGCAADLPVAEPTDG